MKKEEILEASRKENKSKDLAVIEAENSAVKIASLAMLILSTVYYALGIFITGKSSYGWYSMLALYCTLVYGIRGMKSKKKNDIFISVIWLLVTIITTVSYISDLINSSTIL